MVLEFAEHDLSGLIREGEDWFDLSARKHIMKQTMAGLKFIHDAGVLHLDLKREPSHQIPSLSVPGVTTRLSLQLPTYWSPAEASPRSVILAFPVRAFRRLASRKTKPFSRCATGHRNSCVGTG
jgi:serine/threonine protein kinase